MSDKICMLCMGSGAGSYGRPCNVCRGTGLRSAAPSSPSVRVTMEEGGRDVWHDAPCRGPMKHLPDRLPIGDGVVLRLYECTACDARVFAGGDKQGRIVYRPAPPPPGEPAGEPTIPQRAECDICGEPGEMDRPILGGTHTDCDDREAEAVPDTAPVAGGEPTALNKVPRCPRCGRMATRIDHYAEHSQATCLDGHDWDPFAAPAVAPVTGAGGEDERLLADLRGAATVGKVDLYDPADNDKQTLAENYAALCADAADHIATLTASLASMQRELDEAIARAEWAEQSAHSRAMQINGLRANAAAAESRLTSMQQERERLARQVELHQRQIERRMPCADHRDKVTDGVCLVCRATAAESRVATLEQERDGIRTAVTDAINVLEWLHWQGGLGMEKHEQIMRTRDSLTAALASVSQPTRKPSNG